MKIKHYQIYFFVTLFSISLLGCKTLSYYQQDPFYRNGSEWDHLRFPLIKPYYATFISNDQHGWAVNLEGDPLKRDFPYTFSIDYIGKIAVEKSVIMIYRPIFGQNILSSEEEELSWFVIVPDQMTEKGFAEEADFLSYIEQFDIQTLLWQTPSAILDEYDKTKCLDWIPNCQ